jgi:two-component system OmpR family sensor kinase
VALDQVVAEIVERHPDVRVVVQATEPVKVYGEREALKRSLENLIENGLVHGPPRGQVTVAVGQPGDQAVVAVSDEGPGPSPQDADRLFERFWRGPESSERPGSGLGLSIVAAIVERHGGRIFVQGSTFTVQLPLLDRSCSGAPDQNPSVANIDMTTPHGRASAEALDSHRRS